MDRIEILTAAELTLLSFELNQTR